MPVSVMMESALHSHAAVMTGTRGNSVRQRSGNVTAIRVLMVESVEISLMNMSASIVPMVIYVLY